MVLARAGKGTTAIPDRGVYKPLLSAMSITSKYDVGTGSGLSAGAIAGIMIGSCTFIVLILVVLWKKGYLGGDKEDKGSTHSEGKHRHLMETARSFLLSAELRALELQTCYFSLRQIKSSTHNFDSANKIGEGGFGPVYKGVLSNGSEIAVKQLSARSKQGNREFVTEIGMISAPKEEFVYFLDWAYVLQEQGNLLELVDPSLGKYSKEEAMRMLNLALLCTSNPKATHVSRGQNVGRQTHVSTILAHSLGPRSIYAPWTGSSIYKDESKEDSPENKLLPDLYDVDI
ncbi:hypothetical protein L1987_78274 [Smallanthus sonchifolius]|uniref:Uncharacterized protein n=1 Tax=Smallanthus sonchifolius TaxID=185202 RepID=A0ACB8ZBD3_9ASTR|nr:hypothetical protein L1987_78274 [Smallanthus sonchifolius]